jgi:hypothetical protein
VGACKVQIMQEGRKTKQKTRKALCNAGFWQTTSALKQ